MRYRRFGKTNLFLSVFSLGMMRCLASEEVTRQTVHKAISLGVNHLETARGYGKSEQFLGAILGAGELDRSQLIVTTKISPTPDASQMEEHLQDSLQRLKLDYIDCLAVHGLNTWEHLEWVQAENGCMKVLRQAVEAGKIKHLGFSTHGPLDVILAAINTDLFEFVNLHYYYFFQRNAAAVELAHQKDMGIFIISPADKGGQLYTPPDTLKNLCYPFSPLHLTYRFLLSNPLINTLSVGAANPEELDFPLSVADADHPLTPEENTLFKQLETQASLTLQSEKCSQCFDCLPCPESINIPEVLRLRNLAIAYDMTDFGKYRYRMFENAGHWFPGTKASRCTDCGDCLPRCPENLDIPTLLKDTHQRLNTTEGRRLWD